MELGLPQPSINTRTALRKQANFSVNNTETAFTVSTSFAAGVGPFISGFVGKIKKKSQIISWNFGHLQTLTTLDVFLSVLSSLGLGSRVDIRLCTGLKPSPWIRRWICLPYISTMIKEKMRFAKFIPFHKLATLLLNIFIQDGGLLSRWVFHIVSSPTMFTKECIFPEGAQLLGRFSVSLQLSLRRFSSDFFTSRALWARTK